MHEKLLNITFVYEDADIVVSKATYQANKKITQHIDIGYKDEDGDIVKFHTVFKK